MKKCPKCNTYFDTKRFTCPLCKYNLEECNDKDVKPVDIVSQPYPKYNDNEDKKKSFVSRLFVFLSIIIALSVGLFNYLFNKHDTGLFIFLIVIASMLVAWTFIKGIIISKANFPFRVLSFGTCLFGLLLIINYDLSPNSWALNYMLSFILLAVLITIVFAIFFKLKRFKNYISLLFGVALLNCVPMLLFKLGVISVSWPASASLITGISVFLGIFLFGWKSTLIEIKKRFHA